MSFFSLKLIQKYQYIPKKNKLIIGENVYIGPFATIICYKKITIGEGTQIGSCVTLVDTDHNYQQKENVRNPGVSKSIKIGRFCWLGSNVVILKGVKLGDYCVVGAGSVVTKSFPENSIIAGNPAKVIKKRMGVS